VKAQAQKQERFCVLKNAFSVREGESLAGSFPEFRCGLNFPPELPVRTSLLLGK